jgi:probable HAF family extracellular repeat protein
MKTKILRNTLLSLGVPFALAATLPLQLAVQGQAPNGPKYRKYKLIEVQPLGGTDSYQVAPLKNLNNRGESIAQSTTATPDPYCPNNCFSGDGLVTHPVVLQKNGILTDLGAPAGVVATMNSGIPTWIDDNGLIEGLYENGLIDPLTGFPEFRAALWGKNGSAIDLGTLGGNSSQGNGVNSRGQVVGVALNAMPEDPNLTGPMYFGIPAATQVRAFLWQNGAIQDLGTLGGNDANPLEINESGQIAGYSYTDSTVNDSTGLPTTHPFLWEKGQMRDLGSLGGTLALPSRIDFPGGQILNSHGQVAGTSTLAGDMVEHAFVWTGEMMRDLGTLGGNNSEGTSINDAGAVVGRSDVSPTSQFHHAFLWEHGTMTDLGVVAPCHNSTANDINARGQVVGGFGRCTDNPDDLTFFSAFLWERGKPIVDLNTLVSPATDLHLTDAAFINERGEIAGVGLLPNGETRAVLLVPLPGP